MKNSGLCAALSCLFLVSLLATSGSSDTDLDKVGQVDPERRILQKALQYTGFDETPGYGEDKVGGPKLVTEENDNSPFLHSYFVGRQVWVVSFYGIQITYEGSEGGERSRDFDVYVDPESERLLKVTSVTHDVEWEYAPSGSAMERERNYRKSGLASMSLPEDLPTPLRAVLEQCVHPAYSAAEIDAIYVDKLFEQREDPERVWQLTLRGIPPLEFFGPGAEEIPVTERTSVTVLADPTTGKTLGTVAPAW